MFAAEEQQLPPPRLPERHLLALREPSIKQAANDRTQHVYRFVELPTFTYPVSVRLSIRADGSGELVAKVTNGSGGYDPGVVVLDKTVEVPKSRVDQFLSMLNALHFWSLPAHEESDLIILDGTSWYLEGADGGKYHIVEREYNKQGVLAGVRNLLIKQLAGIDREKVETLRSGREWACAISVDSEKKAGRSPDGKWRIERGEDLGLWLRGRSSSTRLADPAAEYFLTWSPDSLAFTIDSRETTWATLHSSRLFRVTSSGTQQFNPASQAAADFAKLHSCPGQANNLYTLRWLGPDRVVLILEVPPISECGSVAAAYAGYLVDASDGKILARFDEHDVWEMLGNCAAQHSKTNLRHNRR